LISESSVKRRIIKRCSIGENDSSAAVFKTNLGLLS